MTSDSESCISLEDPLSKSLKCESSPPLPSINERLGYLRPSRELLEYYRKKISEYDDEHDQVVQKLEKYKLTYQEQHKIQWELKQREEEIVELQKALSDMQVYLFQEREHVLRLYAENDRLKIRELEDRKKIHKLLSLSGLTENEVSYFLKEPPSVAIVAQKLPPKLQNLKAQQKNQNLKVQQKKSPKEVEAVGNCDNQTLEFQIESLQAQLEEQARLSREQVDALMSDRQVKQQETDTRSTRCQEKINTLTEKLHHTQDLLYDSTQDFLKLRYEGRSCEHKWMTEKDKLLQELDSCKQQLNLSRDDVLNVSTQNLESRQKNNEETQMLQYQMKQAQKLAEMYREQVIQLEEQLSKIREEDQVGRELFKDRAEKMAKRLELMNARYQDLERRRNLEVQGFKTDISNLRSRLKDMEKQLYKVTINLREPVLEKRPDDLDMQILKHVRRTAGRSKKLMGDLNSVKAKVYGLENELRHL